MKKILKATGWCGLALAGLMISVSCTDYPTRYERVEADRLRVLGWVVTNLTDTADTSGRLCEAAPGDSVQLTAYFAGEPLYDLQWQVSWDVLTTPFGQDTAFTREPLDYVEVAVDSPSFSAATEIRAIRFKIRDDIFAQSPGLSDDLFSLLGVDKTILLSVIDGYARLSPEERAADTVVSALLDSYGIDIGAVTQLMSSTVMLFAVANDVNRMRGRVQVRYNRLMEDQPKVFTNRNPGLKFLGVHKVKGPAKATFTTRDMGATDTTFVLYPAGGPVSFGGDRDVVAANVSYRDTVVIDKGYLYYVAVDSGVVDGVDDRDTGVALTEGAGLPTVGTPAPEIYFVSWFYEFDPVEFSRVDHDDLPLLINGGSILSPLYPSLDERVTEMSIWAKTYDFFTGERIRAIGTTVLESRVHFEYTDDYLDSLADSPY